MLTGIPDNWSATLAFGSRSEAPKGAWKNYSFDLPKLIDGLTTHGVGEKDGKCFLQGSCVEGNRNAKAMDRLYIVGIDVDNGTPSAELDRLVKDRGLFCIRYSTHSSGASVSEIRHDDLVTYQRANPGSGAREYLINKRGYLPAVLDGCEEAAPAMTGNGKVVRVTHKPMDKNRLVFVLAKPWDVDSYPTQTEALAAWKRAYIAFADWLGLVVDESCTDVSRLFYMPRHADGAPYEAVVHPGKAIDIFALVSSAGSDNPFLDAAEAMGAKDATDSSAMMQNLRRWAASGYADTFMIADALEARSPDVMRPEKDRGDIRHIECPFQDEHSDPSAYGGTFVINAGESSTNGFVVGCHHNACAGRDRLDFLSGMISRGWLTTEDLCAPEFHLEVEEGEPRSTHGELFLGEGAGDGKATKATKAKAEGRSVWIDEDSTFVMDAIIEEVKRINQTPMVFSYGGKPSRVITDDTGSAALVRMDLDRMRNLLMRNGVKFLKKKGQDDCKEVPAPADLVNMYLALEREETELPILKGVVGAPAFLAGGVLHDKPGYDSRSMMLYHPPQGFKALPVPVKPT
ncbi:hypothetical protein FZ983_16595 [Azospirillum sp. B21]|uniref:hypothetical protein n=1 Tax=Azospirillum sp. B21 TaxID=2607496 RepID=UPI0011ECFC70|nr:hypothetical protein [Azospirillum sp. B21]KAA0578950.1 hypothetical protein FZ983_16595 [Azospirillum sp. B21]